jgi:hypothetical protein
MDTGVALEVDHDNVADWTVKISGVATRLPYLTPVFLIRLPLIAPSHRV